MQDVTLAVLAGGQARRMAGKDKGLVLFQNKPLLAHVLDSVPANINKRLIIANRHAKQYSQWGYPVYPDVITGFLGPLAGIHSALSHATSPYVLCLPCDTPLLPHNLAADLYQALDNQSRASTVFDGERIHASCLLLARDCLDELSERLHQRELKLQAWLQTIKVQQVDFSAQKACFVNLNSFPELQQLEK